MSNDFFYPWRLSGRITNTLLKFLLLKPLVFLYRLAQRSLPRFTYRKRRPLPGRHRRR